MLKCYNYDIVCQEIPSEVTIAFNITNCPIHCPGCHSQHLWEDIGTPLDENLLSTQLDKYDGDITCVCFMGGDASYHDVEQLCRYVRANYPGLKTAWWSGRSTIPSDFDLSVVDFIKIGPYIEELGGLKSPKTNQALYRNDPSSGLVKIAFKLIILLFGLFSLGVQPLSAQQVDTAAVGIPMGRNWNFGLDIYDNFYFDNREFDGGIQGVSETVFGNKLMPVIGFIHQNKASRSAIHLGAVMSYDMGGGKPYFEFPVYFEHITEKGFSFRAGIVPSKYFYDDAPTAFFSDAHRFRDAVIDGVVLRWSKPEKYEYSLSLDWMGMYSADRRERFMIYSSGRHSILSWLSLGYNVYYYHLACSGKVDGVVDNALVYPYIKFPLSAGTDWRFDLRLGYLQALQQERKAVGKYVFPGGVYSEQNIAWKHFFLRNGIYYGAGLQPYYNWTDAGGNVYGDLLYFGDPLFGFDGRKLYDRIKFGYGRDIIKGISFDAYLIFHFNTLEPRFFSGFTQVFTLKVDMSVL
ncbi:MAG: anaerobic ribonucleoside-triphosphate reductase activating protein [Bacteroidales bacterium]|nr:anaerobic ribonucleoside-triphosphate reductase activating protein [Bacteroidales bacterium]